MDRRDALRLLATTEPDDRLKAARYLRTHAHLDDVRALQAALATETHRWVKSAIEQVLAALISGPHRGHLAPSAEDEEKRILEEVRADACKEIAKQFLHELRPIIGRLDVWAGTEFESYPQSKTKAEWQRLRDFLNFISKLSDAAASPEFAEFDLASTIEGVVAGEQLSGGVTIQCSGPKPHLILSSSEGIQTILSNALRNAIEATKEINSPEPIVVSWGTTDKDHYIAVLDKGCGLPPSTEKIYDIGITTKKGHLGVGLALAKQTSASLNGSISLTPRESGGTAFEFRWPAISKL